MGRHEEGFEAAFRTEWMPALAADTDARLLYFMRLADGTGRAYNFVTVTGGAPTAPRGSASRHRMQLGDLRDVGQAGRRDALGRHREDAAPGRVVTVAVGRLRPRPGRRWRARPDAVHGGHRVAARGDARGLPRGRARQLRAEPRRRSPRRPVAARAPGGVLPGLGRGGTTARGDPVAARDPSVGHPRAPDVGGPGRAPRPGTWMHDALRVRDDWESRLLRTAPWSPLF